MYKCSKCSKVFIKIDGLIIKTCSCEAPIIAEMSAKAHGKGKL